jgi:hypothetical protein
MLLLLLACNDTEEAPPDFLDQADDAGLVALDSPRLLRRLSLDIRGSLPGIEELDAVEASPDAVWEYRDQYLEDPRFEEWFVQVLADRWKTAVNAYLINYFEYLEFVHQQEMEYPFERSVAEEPLRLMAHVAASDAPWSEIVTADYTYSNEILASVWPVDYPGEEGWMLSRYTDNRPAAGVLATNGLWWRYYTTVSNLNRGRAAAIAKLLLCEDYLSRPISFSNQISLVDASGIESALHSNPYCMGCHSAIDPIASSIFGFYPAGEYNGPEMHTYHPEREVLGKTLLGVEPGWYGQPVEGLKELGQRIAEDPRFLRCSAQSAAEMFWKRPVEEGDFERIESLRQVFLLEGGKMKPLIQAVTETAVYQAGSLDEQATALEEANETTLRMVTASLLGSMIEELTGWRWWSGGFDQLNNDTYGFRLLGGGLDGSYVNRLQQTPGVTWNLVVERVAQGAAQVVVEQELAQGGEHRFFGNITLETAPGSPEFEAEAERLHWRLYAVRADDGWLSEISSLYGEVQAAAGSAAAWEATVSAMLRDPLFVGY